MNVSKAMSAVSGADRSADRDDFRPRIAGPYRQALDDIAIGLGRWRIWWLLGIGDVRQRYRRSRLGQFWITLSMAVFVVALGFLYSVLFKQPIEEYLPFIAVNMVLWNLMSGIITDSTTAYTQAEPYLRQEFLPRTVFIMRLLVRNFISFSHNLLIIPLIFLFFGKAPSWTVLLALPGLVLIAVAGFFAAVLCATLCTRFRDLPQIVQNVIQIAFFLSPVMWRADLLGAEHPYVTALNPFTAFLHVAAEPVLGRVPDASTYASALIVIGLLAAIAVPLFARYRARIVYWL